MPHICDMCLPHDHILCCLQGVRVHAALAGVIVTCDALRRLHDKSCQCRSLLCGCAPQELEGRLHWAAWALEQGLAQPQDLAPPPPAAAKSGNPHTVPALTAFFALLPPPPGPQQPSDGLNRPSARRTALAGCDKDVQRLAARALQRTGVQVLQLLASPLHVCTQFWAVPV